MKAAYYKLKSNINEEGKLKIQNKDKNANFSTLN